MTRTLESKIKNREYMKTYNLIYYAKNKQKVLARNKDYAKKHPEIMTKIAREYRKRYPDRQKNSWLKYRYGISLEDYNNLLKKQNNVCAICHKKGYKRLSVDHSHKDDRVRGLLCDSCNCALGLLKEDLELVNNLILYIKKYE